MNPLPGFDHFFPEQFPEGNFPLRPWGKPPQGLAAWAHNAPARFAWGSRRYTHWLDGEGMIVKVQPAPHPRLQCRYVQSSRWQGGTQGQRLRAFGTGGKEDALELGRLVANPANIHVQSLEGKLLAFGEQGRPYRLNPHTLETEGVESFDHALDRLAPFSAHAKPEPRGWVNFGVDYHPHHPRLALYSHFKGKTQTHSIPLDAPYCLHDFVSTPHFLGFHLSPYTLDLFRLLAGHNVLESLSWIEGGASQMGLWDRRTQDWNTIDLSPGYCLHFINGFTEKGRWFVDGIVYPRPLYPQFGPLPLTYPEPGQGQVTRWEFENGQLQGENTLPYTNLPDFPHLNPKDRGKEYTHFWGLGSRNAARREAKFFDELVEWSWEEGSSRQFSLEDGGVFSGEPLIVPDEAGADWIVTCASYPTQERSRYLVFKPHFIEDGPVGGWDVPHLLPLAIHGAVLPIPTPES